MHMGIFLTAVWILNVYIVSGTGFPRICSITPILQVEEMSSGKSDNLPKFPELRGDGTGVRIRAVLQATDCPVYGNSHTCQGAEEGGEFTVHTERRGQDSGRGGAPETEPEAPLPSRPAGLRPHLYVRVILQQPLGRLRLQFPLDYGTFDLRKEDTVQFVPLENGQLPVGLGKVFLSPQRQGPP